MSETVDHPPPAMLDGARVLWWAWSGDVPFGEHYGDSEENRWVHGFAVCCYDSGKIYRFSCNRNWEVVNDMDHDSEDAAKASIPLNYDAARVRWRKYEGT
jgi:hypothetical protein